MTRMLTEEKHPQLKNGLLITTQLPFRLGADADEELAATLNHWEATAWTDFPQIGCWHFYRGTAAHTSFIPNALYRPGLVLNFAAWSAARARAVSRTFWPNADDATMQQILSHVLDPSWKANRKVANQVDKKAEQEVDEELERLVQKVKRNHPNATEDEIRRMLIASGT